MSNISEFIYEIIAALVFCSGIAFAINLYNTGTQQLNTTTQINAAKENVAESVDGYQGDNLIDGATVITNIMADGGETKTIVDGSEISRDTIVGCVEEKDTTALKNVIDADATYLVTYTEDEDSSGIKAVNYEKK